MAGDDKIIDDTKAIIHNTRQLTDKAGKLKERLNNIKVTSDADLLYSGMKKDWSTNFNVNIGEDKGGFLNFGVDDIGNADRGNFQAGTRFGNLGARAGVIYGEPGIGVDAYAGEKFKFSADAYDLNDPAVLPLSKFRDILVDKSTINAILYFGAIAGSMLPAPVTPPASPSNTSLPLPPLIILS